MKTLALTALSFTLSITAFAAGPSNVYGVSGRLETLTCVGAYVAKKSFVETSFNPAVESACAHVEGAAAEQCMNQMVRRMLTAVPRAVFTGTAMDGTKTFNMQIVNGGTVAFSSIREGFHGDGVDGISLMFNRVGVAGDDYMIESSQLADNGNSVSSLIVPVKRRLVADLVYFFIDGCHLVWSGDRG